MLLRDTKARPSARQLLQHPLVLGYTRAAAPTAPPPSLQAQTAQLLSATSVSDSVSSMEGTHAPRLLSVTPAGKQPSNGAACTPPGLLAPRAIVQLALDVICPAHEAAASV